MTVEISELERVLGKVQHFAQVQFTEPGSRAAAPVPQRWQPIKDSDDAEARRLTALSLWHKDFLELVPEFANALKTELADVRVGHLDGEAVLVYAFERFDGDERFVVCWLGWDPALSSGADLRFPDAIPGPVRRFYSDVHAGFLAPDWFSNGPIQPRHLQTYAEYVESPDGVPYWPAEVVPATRLLLLATSGGDLHLCVSPDLPPGQAITVYSGVPEPPEDVGTLLDERMIAQLDAPDWEDT